jgi:hypothetical protein
MVLQVQDTPAPARHSAKSLKALYDRMGGEGREKAHRFEQVLSEGVRDRKFDVSGVLLEDVARIAYGEGWRQRLADRVSLRESAHDAHVMESGQPVVSGLFSAATTQLIYSTIRQHYEIEDFVFSREVPTTQSTILGTETVPEVTPIGDASEAILENQEYPSVTFGQATYTLPASAKRGMKVEISEEALRFTGQLTASILKQAVAIGKFLGLRKEISLIDVIIGVVNNYIRNGTATNTYLTTGAYINNQTSLPLTDYRDIDAAKQLLNAMRDPDNTLPFMQGARRHLIVMPENVYTAKRILNATEIRSGDITTGAGVQMASANPLLDENLKLLSSELLYDRVIAGAEAEAAKAQAGWFYGSLEAFGWKELMPLQVFARSGESDAEFERDIVLAYKARYHGVAYVNEPRLITRNEDSAWVL